MPPDAIPAVQGSGAFHADDFAGLPDGLGLVARGACFPVPVETCTEIPSAIQTRRAHQEWIQAYAGATSKVRDFRGDPDLSDEGRERRMSELVEPLALATEARMADAAARVAKSLELAEAAMWPLPPKPGDLAEALLDHEIRTRAAAMYPGDSLSLLVWAQGHQDSRIARALLRGVPELLLHRDHVPKLLDSWAAREAPAEHARATTLRAIDRWLSTATRTLAAELRALPRTATRGDSSKGLRVVKGRG